LTFRLEAAMDAKIRERLARVAALSATVLRRDPRQAIFHARQHLADYRARLCRSMEHALHGSQAALGGLDARLRSLSPLSVLDRGYALVLAADGQLVRSVEQLTPGSEVTTRLADGAFSSRVESVAPGQPHRKRTRKAQS